MGIGWGFDHIGVDKGNEEKDLHGQYQRSLRKCKVEAPKVGGQWGELVGFMVA